MVTQRTRGFLGFAMAFFGVSGIVVSSGLGWPSISLILLFIGVGITILMMMDSVPAYSVRSIVGVAPFYALGCAIGWAPFPYVQGARMLVSVPWGRTP